LDFGTSGYVADAFAQAFTRLYVARVKTHPFADSRTPSVAPVSANRLRYLVPDPFRFP